MTDHLYNTYLASRHVTTDSRDITPGCIFFALRGEHFDGNAFVPQALAEGAALCVSSDRRYRDEQRVVVVDDVPATLQQLAATHRSHLTIPVIGITGTNGKTTTSILVKQILEKCLGAKVGLIGSISNMIGQEEYHTEHTTPESSDLQALFRQMADAGCTYCVPRASPSLMRAMAFAPSSWEVRVVPVARKLPTR